jgi:threonine/homoserine/homoserine lactone efflux protein
MHNKYRDEDQNDYQNDYQDDYQVTYPAWLLVLGCASQLTSWVLLALYLFGHLKCDKYVSTVLTLTTAWWLAYFGWWLSSKRQAGDR